MPSAVIRYFHYDADRERLTVVFQTGRKYVYSGVPHAVADGWRQAFSKGEYFNEHIRDRFEYTREDDVD